MAFTDRDALLALFQLAGGPNWTSKENWGTDAELSQWYGIGVDDQDRVVKLDLRDNSLKGVQSYGVAISVGRLCVRTLHVLSVTLGL